MKTPQTPPASGRTTVLLIILSTLATASIFSNCTAGPGNSTKAKPSLMLHLPANVIDAEMQAVTGQPIRLSKYTGKVVLINLWATWCGPCKQETPELVRLHKQYRAQGLEILGLSTENPEESADNVRKFIQDFDIDYRVGWTTPEVAGTLMQGTNSIPQSFIVTRDGRIVNRFVGFNPRETPPKLQRAIEAALSTQAPN